jgi:hypothetical protein
MFREHLRSREGEIFNAPMISKDVRDLAAADVEGFDAVMPRSNHSAWRIPTPTARDCSALLLRSEATGTPGLRSTP